MPVTVIYNVEGIEPVAHRLMAFAAKAIDPAPALEFVAEQLRMIEAALFAAEGYGAWPPLASSTIAAKGHDTIGIDSKAMLESLTDENAEGAMHLIIGDELIFGTNLTSEEGFPYPKAFNDGTRSGQPPRPLFNIRPEDLRMISKGIQAYLVGVDRALFGLNRGGDHIPGSDLMPRF